MEDKPEKKTTTATKPMTKKEAITALQEIATLMGGHKQSNSAQPPRKNAKAKGIGKDQLKETIDFVRVCAKYIIFDNEAYKRELKKAKKLIKELEENQNND